MNLSVYTLLIVESPVIAGIIQNVSPPSVYVIATGGYCWRPVYDEAQKKLKLIADPDKTDVRREMKEQAQWANSIIIATDSDPSGDFIAWSLHRFLKKPGIKRARIQNLSKTGVLEMLNEAVEMDTARLEVRLQNRYLIRKSWKKSKTLPDFQLSGITTVLGKKRRYHHFIDEYGNLYRSTESIQAAPDGWISIQKKTAIDVFKVEKPLSTFDVTAMAVEAGIAENFTRARELLQELFQTKLPFSDESLISYPRSDARAYYGETWNSIRSQYIKFGALNDLKPTFLQEIADPETPHESIHPIDLTLKPEHISGTLPENLEKLYELIYSHTLDSITMPKEIKNTFVNELHPGTIFFNVHNTDEIKSTNEIRPCMTTSDFGMYLNRLGVCKPSGFGESLDKWISQHWIHIKNGVVYPGNPVLRRLNHAEKLYSKFKELNEFAENELLSPETVNRILSS